MQKQLVLAKGKGGGLVDDKGVDEEVASVEKMEQELEAEVGRGWYADASAVCNSDDLSAPFC